MDHIKVIKQSFRITWNYRALWVFGIILALVTGGGGGSNPTARTGGGAANGTGAGGGNGIENWLPRISPEVQGLLIALGALLALYILILIAASVIARWVAETSLIRMVSDGEATGTKLSVWQGFGVGWSRTAWRLFLLDLLVVVPVTVAAMILFALAGAPALLWLTGNRTAGIVGTVVAVGLVLLVVLLVLLVALVMSVLNPIWRRACALENVGVIEALRRGWATARRNWKDLGLMWLLLVGLGLIWALVMLVVVLALLFLALPVAGLPTLLVAAVISLIISSQGSPVPWIAAALVGLPVFAVVIGLPALFLDGLKETFVSTVWTLTYRELRALEPDVSSSVAPSPAPVSDDVAAIDEPVPGDEALLNADAPASPETPLEASELDAPVGHDVPPGDEASPEAEEPKTAAMDDGAPSAA